AWQEQDVTGSPYAIYSYEVDPFLGSTTDLLKLKADLNSLGLGLILDFVPNHLAIDHPWTNHHPEFFIQGKSKDAAENPELFFKINKRYLAHGKDPYFSPWSDTAQINYFSNDARQALIDELLKIALMADGVRCDMAMLVINRIFTSTWDPYLETFKQPGREFWQEAIEQVKSLYPDFIFIAEAYWDLERELQNQGFDYTYDKKLYDLLVHAGADKIQDYLKSDLSYQEKCVRFIENHDEPRAASVFGIEKSFAAACITATLPGMHFFHDGQKQGNTVKLPVQLSRKPEEKPNPECIASYERLFAYIHDEAFHSGIWQLVDISPAWQGNESFGNVLAWLWHAGGRTKLVIVNYSASTSQARTVLPDKFIGKKQIIFKDHADDAVYKRDTAELTESGLYVVLGPWKIHLFDLL
ncbi:MAG: hypothetical protein JW920_04750, partial [Deltaproteobacteria bacterium]|nr:hypothetical protein [Deltaproteobacteria bacterium]